MNLPLNGKILLVFDVFSSDYMYLARSFPKIVLKSFLLHFHQGFLKKSYSLVFFVQCGKISSMFKDPFERQAKLTSVKLAGQPDNLEQV